MRKTVAKKNESQAFSQVIDFESIIDESGEVVSRCLEEIGLAL